MKNIKINIATLYLLVIFFLCGLIKDAIIIFLIVFFHEIGHVFFIKLFSFEIVKMEFFPFGGYTKVNKLINTSLNKDFFISIGGFLFQIIIYLLSFLLLKINLLNENTFNLFLKYNTSILFFNLIPIYPLDGYAILNIMFNKFFSYKVSYNLSIIFSLIFIILYILFNYKYSINNYLIVIFLFYKLTQYIKNYKYLYNKFLLERYLNDFNFKNIKKSKKAKLDVLKKDTKFYFYDKFWYDEKKLLKKRFEKGV